MAITFKEFIERVGIGVKEWVKADLRITCFKWWSETSEIEGRGSGIGIIAILEWKRRFIMWIRAFVITEKLFGGSVGVTKKWKFKIQGRRWR